MSDTPKASEVVDGLAFRGVLFGDSAVSGHLQGATQRLAPQLNLITDRALFEEVWQADGLALRDRSLVTIAALGALGRERELGAHIAAALELGISREELTNVFVQLAWYVGLPPVHGALRAIDAVFSAIDERTDGVDDSDDDH